MASTLTSSSGNAPLGSPAPGYDCEAADTQLASTNYTMNPGVIARAFRVGTTAGNVAVITAAGNTTIIPAVQVGETVAVCFTAIVKASTTAAGITVFS
jgi:hypothetical protein